ncbi:NAD-dependent epimerase/dehydratase family protein, partial [bacterium]
GDIREKDRLERAMDGANIVIHAAALKQVPVCEYNPFEAVKTNILGAQNIIEAAIDHNIDKVMAISTDKAVNPVNLYGATKMCMEKLFVAANSYVGSNRSTRMACVRYGNVVGSRGSVIPLFKKQRACGKLTITDKDMTRFWITLEEGVGFVVKCVELMKGGEVFVPKIPSMSIMDLAKTIAPECGHKFTGIRPGEKLHEVLISRDESRRVLEFKDFFIIHPDFHFWSDVGIKGGKPIVASFEYNSKDNPVYLTGKQMIKMDRG